MIFKNKLIAFNVTNALEAGVGERVSENVENPPTLSVLLETGVPVFFRKDGAELAISPISEYFKILSPKTVLLTITNDYGLKGKVVDGGIEINREPQVNPATVVRLLNELGGQSLSFITSLSIRLDSRKESLFLLFQKLDKLKNLKKIEIEGIEMTDTEMERLGTISSLEEITLKEVRVTDNGLDRLTNLKRLKKLSVNSNFPITTERVSTLRKQLPGLEVTIFRQTREGPAWELVGQSSVEGSPEMIPISVAILMTSIRDIKGVSYLMQSYGILIRVASSANLSEILSTLQGLALEQRELVAGLDFSGCPLNDFGLKMLPDLPNLEELDLRETLVTDQGFSTIVKFQKLRKLVLGNTKVTNACLPELFKLSSLQDLDISWTAINNYGAFKIYLKNFSLVRINTYQSGITSIGRFFLEFNSEVRFE